MAKQLKQNSLSVEETPLDILPMKEEEFAYVPDIPDQMHVDEKVEIQDHRPKIKEDSEEVLFLKKILHVQHSGGWGRHLDNLINERLKKLYNE